MFSNRPKQRFDVDPFLERISEVIPDNEIDERFLKFCSIGRPKKFKSSQLYRSHLLTLLKQIPSFNKFCEQLKIQRALRDFCHFHNKLNLPIRRTLSEFRDYLNEKGLVTINDILLKRLLKIIGLPKIVVAVVDSTDIPASCYDFKRKRCKCKSKCSHPKKYTAQGATKGVRTKRAGETIYFVGYKKHTLRLIVRLNSKFLVIPLVTFTASANKHDKYFLIPFIEAVQDRLKFHLDIIVADMNYIDSKLKKETRIKFKIALLTKARSNMLMPDELDSDGCPSCHYGQRLIHYEYDSEIQKHIYIAPEKSSICIICPYQGTCEKEFLFDPEISETFLGPVPLHTELANKLLTKIRPLVEQGNEEDKHRFGLESFFVNSLKLAKVLSLLADSCKILTLLADLKSQKGKVFKRVYNEETSQLKFPF